MDFDQVKKRVSEATQEIERQIEESRQREADERELLFPPSNDDKIISLEQRLAAIEKQLADEHRLNRSIAPLLRLIVAEIEGDGEFHTATAEMLEFMRLVRNNEQWSLVHCIKYFIAFNELDGG